MDVFWAAPPVSRTLAAAALITSLLVYGALLSASRVIFYLPWILKFPPELWRLCTPFLITGPKLGILLDPYFLYTYGSSLETESPRFSQPGDFFTYVLLVCCVILFTSVAITGGYIFTPALVLALAYTYAQENPNRKVTYFVVSFKVKWLPYVMLLLTFILQSPEAALQQANGLVAAHLYDFLTRLYPTFGGGSNIIQTPRFVKEWFGGDRRGPQTRGYGTAFTQRQSTSQQGRTSGASSAFGSGSSIWGRTTGRRLGSD